MKRSKDPVVERIYTMNHYDVSLEMNAWILVGITPNGLVELDVTDLKERNACVYMAEDAALQMADAIQTAIAAKRRKRVV